MRLIDTAGSRDRARTDAENDLEEIVLGLHWDPPQEGASAEPGTPRNANCSVLHTGDRLTEREWVRVGLTALGLCTAHCAATLRRDRGNWKLFRGAQVVNPEALAGILTRAARESREGGIAAPASAWRPQS